MSISCMLASLCPALACFRFPAPLFLLHACSESLSSVRQRCLIVVSASLVCFCSSPPSRTMRLALLLVAALVATLAIANVAAEQMHHKGTPHTAAATNAEPASQ